jgi:DNA-binding transcriptional LysR family regulator
MMSLVIPIRPPTAPLNFRTLDLNLLRVFDEVMAERSLTRAAHNLSLTQPAVSNARRLRERWATSWCNATGGQGMAPRPGALSLRGAAALEQLEASASSDFVPLEATDTFAGHG